MSARSGRRAKAIQPGEGPTLRLMATVFGALEAGRGIWGFPKFLADDLAALMVGKARDELVFTGPAGGVLRVSTFPISAR